MRTNTQIIKGSKLMLFIKDQNDQYKPVGFATSHSIQFTTNTTEILTKDHGDFPSQVVQSIGWTVSAENFYSDLGEATYLQILKSKQPVLIQFAEASNYSNDTTEKGVIDSNEEWTVDSGHIIASGKAIITDFSVNAPAGDNATMSVTFTGIGEFDIND